MTAERQLRFWLLWLALFLISLYLLRAVLLPFVAGIAIAYLLDPICDRLERAGCSRLIATCIVTAGFVVVAAALLVLIVPLIEGQIVDLLFRLPDLLEAMQRSAGPLMQALQDRFGAAQIDD